ncbi:MAG: type II toxin-antitoxin system HipA family toxin [Verrucomicrobiaceae bacterium]|nr:type II toxin-antitoxin system HipA family toxin [Verrucomicrobiaceae bacterium]
METLAAFVGKRRMGTLSYRRDRITLEYDADWREASDAFPLSLSMPLAGASHTDPVVRPFLWGLLPDNDEVLRRWGQRFQVSPRNPFRLLAHVGEECAGAVQFLRPERVEEWTRGTAPSGIDWLEEDELDQRIRELVADHAGARRWGDEGHFSLAGAQPKTGLFRDPDSGKWGIPKGTTPTTHLLKPASGQFEDYVQNEHFCLRLAGALGLRVAKSWTEVIGDIPVIVIERFDRLRREGRPVVRVHQEDVCQALAKYPASKYQNEGGPSAGAIFGLIREQSSRSEDDVNRFLDAMIYNWLIGGTDAHSKNYGFLLAGGAQVRLCPLYDLSSSLPYPKEIPPRKVKLAMKIGGTYQLSHIGPAEWERAAREWKLDPDEVADRIVRMVKAIPDAMRGLEKGGDLVRRLGDELIERVSALRKMFDP